MPSHRASRAPILIIIPLLFALMLTIAACGSAQPVELQRPANGNPATAGQITNPCDTSHPGFSEWEQRRVIVECSDQIRAEIQELNTQINQLLAEQRRTNQLLERLLYRPPQ